VRKLVPPTPPPRPHHHHLPGTQSRRGVSSPGPIAVIRVALLSHLLYICACHLSLLARLVSPLTASLGKVPSWVAAHTPKTLHEDAYVVKKVEIDTIRWE
jgi:hypothetical protein